jgi:hypothetical protein
MADRARRRRAARLHPCRGTVVWAIAALLAAGCASEATLDGATLSARDTVLESAGDAGHPFEVPSLGLTFRLPESFVVADDPGLDFLARSLQPRAIMSIAGESSDTVEHEPEVGETVIPTTIAGVEAVVVENAAIDSLPVGVVANELLVANGDDSFSLIMSSDPGDLPTLWNDLLGSIAIR